MGIFTGNEILFCCTGMLIFAFAWLVRFFHKKYILRWYGWFLYFAGALLFIFSLQWAGSSILEGEPQAANMGLILFGVPSLLMLGASWKSAFLRSGPPGEKR